MPRRKSSTNFPRFSRLPLEIQDEIWKLALDINAPTAHFVTLKYRTNFYSNVPQGQEREWWDTCAVTIATECDTSRVKPVFPTRHALMLTCRRSRHVVRRASRLWKPASLHTTRATLIQPLIPVEYHFFHAKGYRDQLTMDQKIDTSQDLTILIDPWAANTVFQQGLPREDTIPQIQCVAIPYLPNDAKYASGIYAHKFTKLLHVLPKLRVLYILVHPDQTRKANRKIDPRVCTKMSAYFENREETQDQVPFKTFQCRDRVYYEIPEITLMQMCQLRKLPKLIEKLGKISEKQKKKSQPKYGEQPPLVIRIMTWRHAPGIRGRFDTG
ncbi:hypothetical protein FSARC_6167 [Fusarium sarcochroum]|uniref:2EXR domain-containing protein n=1 Tax=Fusarium sarcochroum TaxID=1208366 RepID=A0A8H4TY04_9HYPO|nr:hypothetical protein FSARC_6167 [Fusarium sarcochroum]